MRVLLCHSYYQQRGGEDCVYEEERDLLREAGHEVFEYRRENKELVTKSSLAIAQKLHWNRQAARDVRELVAKYRPEVFHVTNSFPLISPSVLREASSQGIAVVQALQNYRLICPGSYLMRDNQPCHDCFGRSVPWPAIRHRCYRDSFAASTAVTSMVTLHRALGTWRKHVDLFFTPTEFARQRFLEAGFHPSQITVKHNMVNPVPPAGNGEGDYFVFVGRLSQEKGIATLLDAWELDPQLPTLKIIGNGPSAKQVEAASSKDARIEWLGHLDLSALHPIVGSAQALIMPSIWYETFGRTTVEAFASGTPVIASNLGAMQELIEPGRTGILFTPGDAKDLCDSLNEFVSLPSKTHLEMREAARHRFETSFTAEQNIQRLLEIYEQARSLASKRQDRSVRESLPSGNTIAEKASTIA